MESRKEQIFEFIKEQGFVNTSYLCDMFHYSTATINRDLNDLQRRGLIRRKYGGAEYIDVKSVPLSFRQHKMKHTKNALALEGSKLISEGMTIFIDGSTTAQYLGKHIADILPLTVITNNNNLSAVLSETGKKIICLGGQIIEKPYITGGPDAARMAATFTADLMIFSTGGVSSDGTIFAWDPYYDVQKAMLKHSAKKIFMIDHKKVDRYRPRVFCDFSQVDTVISDYIFADEVKAKFPNTEFIEIKPFEQDE